MVVENRRKGLFASLFRLGRAIDHCLADVAEGVSYRDFLLGWWGFHGGDQFFQVERTLRRIRRFFVHGANRV